jgi:hypothetical protein
MTMMNIQYIEEQAANPIACKKNSRNWRITMDEKIKAIAGGAPAKMPEPETYVPDLTKYVPH